MRKVVLLEHISLDGFAAGPNGEMDWIHVDDEMFDYVGQLTGDADTALYGRVTYQMMDGYWPTAADQPGATNHDITHGNWYNNSHKIVFSKTLTSTSGNSRIISGNIKEEMESLKGQPGKNLLMIGSPGIAHTFMQLDLIDEYWLYVNPVILGDGIPLFKDISTKAALKLKDVKNYNGGVVGLNYERKIS
jgi:dihydrofolate reductase